MDNVENVQTAQASCCDPTKVQGKSSCCTPLDTEEKTVSRQQDKNKPQPVYSGWVTAETKYGMYLPAINSGSLRDSSGIIKDPLPGPIGVTELIREAEIQEGSKVLEVAASVGHIAILAAKVAGRKQKPLWLSWIGRWLNRQRHTSLNMGSRTL